MEYVWFYAAFFLPLPAKRITKETAITGRHPMRAKHVGPRTERLPVPPAVRSMTGSVAAFIEACMDIE